MVSAKDGTRITDSSPSPAQIFSRTQQQQQPASWTFHHDWLHITMPATSANADPKSLRKHRGLYAPYFKLFLNCQKCPGFKVQIAFNRTMLHAHSVNSPVRAPFSSNFSKRLDQGSESSKFFGVWVDQPGKKEKRNSFPLLPYLGVLSCRYLNSSYVNWQERSLWNVACRRHSRQSCNSHATARPETNSWMMSSVSAWQRAVGVRSHLAAT